MFKTLITLVRGRTVAIAEEVADQNALLILDQQMRDATGALDKAKKALAIAIAQEGHRSVVVVPIAFTGEHIETLQEIDILYKGKPFDAVLTRGQFEAMCQDLFDRLRTIARNVSQNSGKETDAASAPSIVDSPSARKAATAKAMAMR